MGGHEKQSCKQFLPADYNMALYKKLHSLTKRNIVDEECAFKFNNLLIQVGLAETDDPMTSHYWCGLNESIRDEMEVVHVHSLDDA